MKETNDARRSGKSGKGTSENRPRSSTSRTGSSGAGSGRTNPQGSKGSRPPLSEEERQRRARVARRRRREAERRRKRLIFMIAGIIVLLVLVLGIVLTTKSCAKKKEAQKTQEAQEKKEQEASKAEQKEDGVLEQANLLAAQYDYDRAIELLKGAKGYEKDTKLQEAVKGFEETKATCKPYPVDQVTHVFYHTLIKDTSKAFDEDSRAGGYNQVMTTIDEFNKITQKMYDEGYVMVRLQDMAAVSDDSERTMTEGQIMLPPGKKPFVLSQDDVSYYHYMDGDGYATKLIVDENGDVKNEYREDDGSVSVGDFDMIPLIDAFVKEHPDFSYRGAKGIIALTGYNGVLGYRTDIAYKTKENLDENQVQFLDATPDFNYDREVEEATKVAKAMKDNGWEFASHTWGHINVGQAGLEHLQTDTQKWLDYVEPIIGDTDIIIFAFGADLNDWQDYSGNKFEYLKSKGFDYYCNVDSSQYWVQLRDRYLRMGRRNLDGYRMYYNPDMLSDLFTVSEVWDKARPTPVPEMS